MREKKKNPKNSWKQRVYTVKRCNLTEKQYLICLNDLFVFLNLQRTSAFIEDCHKAGFTKISNWSSCLCPHVYSRGQYCRKFRRWLVPLPMQQNRSEHGNAKPIGWPQRYRNFDHVHASWMGPDPNGGTQCPNRHWNMLQNYDWNFGSVVGERSRSIPQI